jgi:hypothetical protein|tara:strand:- start:2436 stop:2834 length:399 start_codon:yes stop_codon:yes gene_type:complete
VSGEKNLEKLLTLMQPKLLDGNFVFCTITDGDLSDILKLAPIASFQEEEGLSLLSSQQNADEANIKYDSVLKGITLSVHSSLDAVGFTAAVANKLANNGIPANVVAAYYHDHVFVPADKAQFALQLLTELTE